MVKLCSVFLVSASSAEADTRKADLAHLCNRVLYVHVILTQAYYIALAAIKLSECVHCKRHFQIPSLSKVSWKLMFNMNREMGLMAAAAQKWWIWAALPQESKLPLHQFPAEWYTCSMSKLISNDKELECISARLSSVDNLTSNHYKWAACKLPAKHLIYCNLLRACVWCDEVCVCVCAGGGVHKHLP